MSGASPLRSTTPSASFFAAVSTLTTESTVVSAILRIVQHPSRQGQGRGRLSQHGGCFSPTMRPAGGRARTGRCALANALFPYANRIMPAERRFRRPVRGFRRRSRGVEVAHTQLFAQHEGDVVDSVLQDFRYAV